MMFCQDAIKVIDDSHIGEVRRKAKKLATDIGLNEKGCGNTSIVATELATNLVRYAPGGELLFRTYQRNGQHGLELLAIDRGPGMANIPQALEDGFSTGGTPGNGLGAVRRLTTEFDIFSTQPGGTVVLARIANDTREPPKFTFDWGVVSRPAPNEIICGDTWRIAERPGELAIMVADGLGHGPLAAEAAHGAATAFESHSFDMPTELFMRADRTMRGTRGAALAVAQVDSSTRLLRYTGVGNIAGSLRSRDSTTGRGLVSHNGTVGVEMRKVQHFDYNCPDAALIVMHSDGLQTRWSFDPYPGLIHRHPAIVASVLWRDFTRGRDDVTVCVVRFSTSAN